MSYDKVQSSLFVCGVNMKLWTVVFFVVIISFQDSMAECPPGQYDPGPHCSFETICSVPSAHSARKHYCDCWCNAGTIRDTVSNKCVKMEDCPDTAFID